MLETGDSDIVDAAVQNLEVVKEMKDVTVIEGTPEVQTQGLQLLYLKDFWGVVKVFQCMNLTFKKRKIILS